MKTLTLILAAVVAVSLAVPAGAAAQEKKAAEKRMTLREGFRQQTACPVMGGEPDGKSYVDYQGQRVHFCCPACEKPFLEDPEKYFEQAAKDSVLFENVQTVCPVTGEPIDKRYFTYYKGRGIYFCCAGCIEKFNADPEKYLSAMDGKMEMKKECEKSEQGYEHKHGQKND